MFHFANFLTTLSHVPSSFDFEYFYKIPISNDQTYPHWNQKQLPSFPIEKFHNQKLTIYSQLYFQFYHHTIFTLCPPSCSPSFFQRLFQIFIPLLHIDFPVISFLSFFPSSSCFMSFAYCPVQPQFLPPTLTSHTHIFYIRSIYRHFRRNKLSN